MTTLETVQKLRPFVNYLPARFMMDAVTYARGGELGYDGFDFYAAGRGGVLGAVDSDVIAAAFIFFNPITVRDYWDRSSKVGPVETAASAFAACAHQWGRDHLADSADLERLAGLLEKVVQSANPAGAPLFAAWRALGCPSDAKARVLHCANALRELRGARHGGAILAAGLAPAIAVQLKSPYMVGLFGWSEPGPDIQDFSTAWQAADDATDVAFAPEFLVLDDAEQAELVELAANAFTSAT